MTFVLRAPAVLGGVLFLATTCGGKTESTDASASSACSNCCTWVAWDGTTIHCPQTGGKLPECEAPLQFGCGNVCGCYDAKINHYECTLLPPLNPCPK